MAISETLLDALGGLLNAKVFTNKTYLSKELNFERYANLSLSAGQIEDKEAEEEKENKKKETQLLEIRYKDKYDEILKKEKKIKDNNLLEEQNRDIFLENELKNHNNCKIELIINKEENNQITNSYSIFCCFSETIELIKYKIKKATGILRRYQNLYYNEQELNDNNKLIDYNINSNTSLKLKVIHDVIYIKTLTGKTITLNFCPSNTIEETKINLFLKKVFLQINKDLYLQENN